MRHKFFWLGGGYYGCAKQRSLFGWDLLDPVDLEVHYRVLGEKYPTEARELLK